jgi:hypothetical protein
MEPCIITAHPFPRLTIALVNRIILFAL